MSVYLTQSFPSKEQQAALAALQSLSAVLQGLLWQVMLFCVWMYFISWDEFLEYFIAKVIDPFQELVSFFVSFEQTTIPY